MGGTTWTDARDQRLFILVLDRANINGEAFAALAAAYKKEYQDTGIDNYAPTAKAIKEHIDKLKKKTSGGGRTPNSTPRKVAVAKTPTNSKTPTTARMSINNTNATPSRSAKRKRTAKSSSDELSDMAEEDTNDERKMLNASKASVAPRSSLSRRSKSLAKSYQQPSEEDDEDEDADAEASAEEVDVNTTIVTSTAVNGTTNAVAEGGEEMDLDSIAVSAGNTNGHPTPQGKTANGEKGFSSKKRAFKRDLGDESDGSDFVPSFFE